MGQKLENAKGLYLDGIRDGNIHGAIDKYTGARYTQHSTGVKDGKEGFIEFFTDFVVRYPERNIEVIRGWEDGNHVFLQAFQTLNNGDRKYVTTDFFDTDENDKLIEHWDVITRLGATSPSGHTPIDGPTDITDLDKTEENKTLVRNMIENVLMEGGDPQKVDQYISTETYIQHNSQVADGLANFKELLVAPDRPLWYHEVVLVVGKGNFVSTLCKARWNETEYAQVDIFRVENGKIVEHWDNAEKVPEVHANSGKF